MRKLTSSYVFFFLSLILSEYFSSAEEELACYCDQIKTYVPVVKSQGNNRGKRDITSISEFLLCARRKMTKVSRRSSKTAGLAFLFFFSFSPRSILWKRFCVSQRYHFLRPLTRFCIFHFVEGKCRKTPDVPTRDDSRSRITRARVLSKFFPIDTVNLPRGWKGRAFPRRGETKESAVLKPLYPNLLGSPACNRPAHFQTPPPPWRNAALENSICKTISHNSRM